MTTPVPGQREGREKFEEWAMARPYLKWHLHWDPVRQEYHDSAGQVAWEAWRARDAEVLSSRRQALEEAARLMESFGKRLLEGFPPEIGGAHNCREFARAIRTLSGEVIPQAGEEGK